jgi:glutathione S-transferase
MRRDYVTAAGARDMPGLRIAFSRGMPGPWGEAVRAFFDIKQIDYVPVIQEIGEPNEVLKEWTGQSSAPVAMLDDERPRAHWSEMLMLAERLQSEPSLIPRDERQRAQMFGLAHEICGEDGFGWAMRELLFDLLQRRGENPAEIMRRKYDGGMGLDHAWERARAVMELLARQLEDQEAAGSDYLVGDRLSAVDIYWTTFSNMVSAMAQEHCPMPDLYRFFGTEAAMELNVVPPEILVHHRDRILVRHFILPMWF